MESLKVIRACWVMALSWCVWGSEESERARGLAKQVSRRDDVCSQALGSMLAVRAKVGKREG